MTTVYIGGGKGEIAVVTDGGGPGASEFLIVNVVDAYGVDNTGAHDAGPRIQAAFNALAGTGQAAGFPAGSYKVETTISVPSGLILGRAGGDLPRGHHRERRDRFGLSRGSQARPSSPPRLRRPTRWAAIRSWSRRA